MTTPPPPLPYIPVLMVALTTLQQTSWAGRLPNVRPGQSFWAKQTDQQPLISAGYARNWVAGDPPAPLPEPPYTAHGTPGVGKGTSNSSH